MISDDFMIKNSKNKCVEMTFLEGFTVTAMPVTIDSKEYANKMAKGLIKVLVK